MRKIFNQPNVRYWCVFLGRTLFYVAIIMILIYLYHYENIDGGAFIYNEF